MKAVIALVKKDLRLFVVDKTAMIISLVVPIALASFFAVVFGGMGGGTQVSKIQVLVVDLDGSPTTSQILASLKAGDAIAPETTTLADARDRVQKGKSGVAVVFPKGFGTDAARAMFYGAKPKLTVFVDPSKTGEAQIVQGRLVESVMKVVSERAFSPGGSEKILNEAVSQARSSGDVARADKLQDLRRSVAGLGAFQPRGSASSRSSGGMSVPFETVTEKLQAPQLDQSAAQVGRAFGGMAIQGLLFQAINAAMAILQDRKRGIYKRLKASPITARQLFFGKLLSSFLVTLLILAAVFVVGFGAFHLRATGSFAGFALICVATSIMAASFGLFVAALGRTEEQSRGLSILAVLCMCMLGGAWFPSFLMPKAMQTAAMVVPVRWAMDGFDAVTWRGLGFSSALPAVGVLLGFTAVFSLIAVARLRWV